MTSLDKMWQFLFGKPLDPLDPRTRHAIAVTPILAWVGLGADGLSSSCYGPEEAFLALGQHTPLALFLALATAATVFIIALGYNQVIELFPTGGGGYRVSTALLGPKPGLVSGAALLVDYVLTVATSLASGVDAFFSLLPVGAQAFKLTTELTLIVLMTGLNFRGMKESIMVLLPIFVGFVVLHFGLIVYGVAAHGSNLANVVPDAFGEARGMSHTLGPLVMIALLMRAFSLGGGTYTGLEAVSNNVNMLAEPRVPSGKVTMFYMATSLAFTAGGIILLYMLWHAKPVEGQTLNAVVFGSVIDHLGLGSSFARHALLAAVLAFEAGLLLVGAQTGFLDGPAVLSNMASDSWVPRHFRDLSTRLVRQNGIVVMGVASFLILLWTHGNVDVLVVLYSINVFLTFSMSLLGLCTYWWRRRRDDAGWLRHFALSALGLSVTSVVLVITLVEKFTAGGWLTVLVTSAVIAACLLIHRHYSDTRAQLAKEDALFAGEPPAVDEGAAPGKPDPAQPTAVLLVGKHRGASMHALLWVNRLFPGHFRNVIFLAVGEVDAKSYDGEEHLERLRHAITSSLDYYVAHCRRHGIAADYRIAFGTHPIVEFMRLADETMDEFPNSVCFASKLIFRRVNFLTAWLHNQTPVELQARLHQQGRQMVLLPMNVG
ncbi:MULTISPECIES: APC family permease [Burkholderia]|uniref:Amino acid transporter n=1 Tax=Burkholderia savannae TaxID=1637837 RepID=A0ABR5T5T5_9BURK|nr:MULTISPECIES: APC family permease [Burkholderia]AOJ71868.1 amino acid transporter [Burkholderia savannae]AOJ83424.1 amino acid transporter [Burkholderia savannae]AOK50335.1 amino acid transporter [Burkholderia sp. MSMB617WGS]KGS02521.1 amino acid permease family protein [Burkholderia sp. ABCPW 111]KVG44739.1 amino acid transporter [Burkholderia sp. MSMB0265]